MKRLPAFLVLMLVLAGAAFAQSWPTRSITLVVPFPAGSGTDTIARIVAEKLSAHLGQPIVIENRAGAAGAIATAYVARAAPDGYTLLMGTSSALMILPLVQPAGSLNFDPVRDFSPIGAAATLPNLLIVSPKLPVNSVAELVEHAKRNPGKLSFASSGPGTITHLIGELFKARTGIEVQHIPYRSGVLSAPDLMEGRVDYLFDNIIWSLPMIRAGQLKSFGITSRERSRLAPDMPTISESGLPGFEAITWVALLAPARTPDLAIQRLNTELAAVLDDPDTVARLANTGAEPARGGPEGLRNLMAADTALWSALIRDANIRVQP